MLNALDLIDLGLVRHFLGEDVVDLWRDCVVALSAAATSAAFARGSRVLLLRQQSATGSAPVFVEVGADHVRCLEWLEFPGGALLLLVGCSSGSLRAFDADGTPQWTVRPNASPLVALRVHTHGTSPDVLLAYEGGRRVGHAAAGWLHLLAEGEVAGAEKSARVRRKRAIASGISPVALEEPPQGLVVAVSCGPLAELPLDLPVPPAAGAETPKQLALVAAGKSGQLHVIERLARHNALPASRVGAAQSGMALAGDAAKGLASSIAGSATFQQLAGSSLAKSAIGGLSSWWGGMPPPAAEPGAAAAGPEG